MSPALNALGLDRTTLPDHTQLPDSDGVFVKNLQEHPQSLLLTDSLLPLLREQYPEGRYCIGQDSGIYWRLASPPEPLEKGAEAPDWFLVLNVPATLDGKLRRSYVLWQEHIAPLIIIEFVSGDGSEERDRTPLTGKFWVYEQAIRPAFYAIYEVSHARVEVYHFIEDRFELLPANDRGHYPIPTLDVELGIWYGEYMGATLPWLRWWDGSGHLLLMGSEQAELERDRTEAERQRAIEAEQTATLERQRAIEAEQTATLERQRAIEAEQAVTLERQRAEQERQRAEQLAERLRALGIDPDAPQTPV